MVGEKKETVHLIPVSAFVVCKNEEVHIAECLRSLDFCEEVIVVDSYSTDDTPEICKQFPNVTFLQRSWPGYREQKEFAANMAKHDWVMFLDADEKFTPQLRDEVINLFRTHDKRLEIYDGFYVCRVMYFLGKWWRKGGWYPDNVIRLFKRDKTSWLGVNPHEVVSVDGRIGKLKGEIEHYSYDNISDQVKKLSSHALTRARADFQMGKPASIIKMFVNPILRFIKFYFIKKGFLEGFPGLVVALLESFYTFLKYAYLWELNLYKKKEISCDRY